MTPAPLAIDLFCGLFGWGETLAECGYSVIGVDIEDMCGKFGIPRPAGCRLVVQDVLTLHGSQLKDAAVVVASPPCQDYSWRAMPWKAAKAAPPPDNALFEACFRIQREACEAAGRHIPMVVENVRGAQKWVGRARWHYGSFYLWGDVPALMPVAAHAVKAPGMNWNDRSRRGQWFGGAALKAPARPAQMNPADGAKQAGSGAVWFDTGICSLPSASPRRKFASAMIAKIPAELARHIGRVYWPDRATALHREDAA